jgi:hypothetical protein
MYASTYNSFIVQLLLLVVSKITVLLYTLNLPESANNVKSTY